MQGQSLGQEDSLEEGMATHSSILAWRIPRTEESGRLPDGVAKSWTQLKWLSMRAYICLHIYVLFFLVALGLQCFVWTLSSCRERGLVFLVLMAFSSWWLLLLQTWALERSELNSYGAQAQLLRGIWNLPRRRIELVSLDWQEDS